MEPQMSIIMESTKESKSYVNAFFENVLDSQAPMLKDMPLVGSPLPTAIILLLYVISIKFVGPTIMKYRAPINPKKWIMRYNFYQIVGNAILFYYTTKEIFRSDNNLCCLQTSRNSAILIYFYYLNKLTDLTETYFFLVKKSWRQISYLHLYHHIAVITCSYLDIYMQPGGVSMIAMWLNTFVHVVMYTYYLLSSWKSDVMFLPMFKKLVTQIQLIQFALCLIAFSGTLFFIDDCVDRKPSIILYLYVTQFIYLIYIFGDFYVRTYVKSKLN